MKINENNIIIHEKYNLNDLFKCCLPDLISMTCNLIYFTF